MEISTVQELLNGKFIFCVAMICMMLIGFVLGSLIQKLKNSSEFKKQRKDAVNRSRAVLGGQFSEQLAPFLPGFPCNPGDVRFVGKPIDFVAFPGSAEGGDIKEIYFIEVKSGQSKLSPREKQIKLAVEQGRVKYLEYRIPDGNNKH
ncbi:Holliday junction resolvase-like protein [Treponema succinifaciens]|uniref:Holliday junction resolvase-like protein n=1 Tax=Treponema TaxID=157 RepID=UPI0023553EDB|nr:Holliday junction resolvase-like protein [Treponema succinifaciens]MCI6913595.1 Holliday junction resolvase [Treponema succinifaciens]MEE0353294.1 Holliday junction resolvase-like protein [Treponema sp.]